MKKKMAKKKRFNLWRLYRESWEYLGDSKKFIYLTVGIFLFFLLFGFFIPAPKFIYDEIINFIKNLLIETQNMSQFETILFIIYNNVQSTFLTIILGIFLGIFPLASTVANGYMLGFVSEMSVNSGGLLSLWRLFPHGIFELPAVFISLGLGLRTGMFIFRKDKIKALKNYLINSLKVFLLIVVPLLIIAGIIEGTLMFLLE